MGEPLVELKPHIDQPNIVEPDSVGPSEVVIVNIADYFFTSGKLRFKMS
jgi:hypothetical protein